MANNFVSRSTVLQYTAPSGGVTGGSVVQVGDIFGVAVATEPAGGLVSVATTGVYDIAKANVVIPHGSAVYWDADNSRVTTARTAGRMIGVAWEPATQAATTVAVQLLGHQSPAIPLAFVATKTTPSQTWAVGAAVYLTSAGTVTSTAGSNTFAGLSLEPAVAASQTTIKYLHLAHL